MFHKIAIYRAKWLIQNITYNMLKIHGVDWDLHGFVVFFEHCYVDDVKLILDYFLSFEFFREKAERIVLFKSFNLDLQLTIIFFYSSLFSVLKIFFINTNFNKFTNSQNVHKSHYLNAHLLYF